MKKNNEQAMLLFIDELVDDLLKASDEDILAEAIEDYGTTDAALGNIRNDIEGAINSLGKDRLAEARAAVALHRSDDMQKETRFNSVECQQRALELLSSDNARLRMTLAARNGRGLSQKDFLSALSDLCLLKEGSGRSVPMHNFGNAPKAERILKELGIT